jgi:hypothetical protein
MSRGGSSGVHTHVALVLMRRWCLLSVGLGLGVSACGKDAAAPDGQAGTAGASGRMASGGVSGSSGANASGGNSAGTGTAGTSGAETGGGAGSAVAGKANGGTTGDGGEPAAGMSGASGTGGTAGSAGTAGAPTGALVAPVFDGESGYVEIPDADIFSEPTTGAISVEAWIRPDSLDMPNRESSGYVHWMGKGVSGEHEWVSRMYQEGNSEDRANRISFYSFNLTGGLGAGSYFQDDVTVGEWIHYVGTFDDTRTYIYKNGVERDSDLLSGYDITPENGSAPVRIGTRDRSSYFQGAIARVAFYSTRLSESQAAEHFVAAGADYDAVILAEPSLVAYYRLDETTGTVARDSKGSHDGAYQGGVELGQAPWPNR